MKKRFIVPVLLLSLVSMGASAQKYDSTKMATLIQAKKFAEAKADMDKIIANPEEAAKPEILGLQTRVYGEIVNDSTLAKQYPDALDRGYNAFELLLKAVPDTAQEMKVLKNPYTYGLAGVSNLYSAIFNKGIKGFNDKDYLTAFGSFKKSQRLSVFFAENGLLAGGNRSAIDTLSTFYAGYAAQALAQEKPEYKDSAVYYYKILLDKNITTATVEPAYKFLAYYYYNAKNTEALSSLLTVAKEKYPDGKEDWDQYGASLITAGATPAQLIEKYNAATNLNQTELETYASAFGKEKSAATDTALKSKLVTAEISAYQKLYDLNPSPLVAYNVGTLTNSKFDALEDQFRASAGQSADLKAKRAAIEASQQTLSDTAAEWFTKAYTALKAKADKSKQEASVYKNTVALLSNIYSWKVDKARGKDTKAFDKYDALAKQFDAEYNALSAAK
ncbi:MAG: hypothetical protein DI598_02745 [Pseudopedobacter saltans]|uniref:Uncharacterized protein n=1 Tax=Pseudopedobacter saltans TaxID=151895 RepID=A0A2W5FDB3_9SPHI|nr:MAG: hypothetical protein DI598_02745 [Pseudopedobacter saltans]